MKIRFYFFSKVTLVICFVFLGCSDDESSENTMGGTPNATFMSGGQFGLSMAATDGENWALGNSEVPQNNNWNLAAGNGVVVMTFASTGATVGGAGFSRYDSFPNEVTSINGPFLRAFTFGNGQFLGISDDGTVYTSSDGLTFVNRTQNIELASTEVVFGNGLFATFTFQITPGPRKIFTSEDGETWNDTTLPDSETVTDIYFGNNLFIAVGTSTGNQNACWVSADGTNWDLKPMGFESEGTPALVAAGNGRIVALSLGGVPGSNVWWSDNNGDTWETGPGFVTNSTLNDMAFGNNRFVAVSDVVAVSSDGGENWSINSPNNGTLRNIIFNP
ncbi:MAG: hypothetical protein AAFQ20_14995 [Bacteroidota bacterium]